MQHDKRFKTEEVIEELVVTSILALIMLLLI